MNATLKRLLAAARTVSEVVVSAMSVLRRNNEERRLPPLPSFKSGGHLVDIADRDALYEVMERR